MQKAWRYITVFFFLLGVIIFLAFVVRNFGTKVTVYLILASPQVPLPLLILICVLVGVVLTLAAVGFRRRRRPRD